MGPLGMPQAADQASNGGAGLLNGLFPLITPGSVQRDGMVGQLFPVISPSPSAAPAAGNPGSLFPSVRPSAHSATPARASARTTVADDSMTTDLPLGEGQIAALCCLAIAACLAAGAARFRTRRRG